MSKILIIAKYFLDYKVVGSKRINYFADFLKEKKDLEPIILTEKEKSPREEYQHELYFLKEGKDTNNLYKIIQILKWIKGIIKVIRVNEIKLIYFSGGPFYYFVLAPIIKLIFGIDYILDFRDPWSLNKKRNVIYYLQKIAIIHSMYTINVTERLTDEYRNLYPKIDRTKFMTIYNGYNDRNLKNIQRETINIDINKDKINIGIFGKFSTYNKNDVLVLLETLFDINKDIPLKIYHLGNIEEYFIEKTKEFNLEDKVVFLGSYEYLKGMKILSEMDCYILNNRSKNALGTKIFDYIYLNKPILGFVDEDYLINDFLSNFKNYFNVRSEEKLKKALNNIFDKNLTYLDRDLDRNKYSRSHQFDILYKKLVNYLDEKE